MYIHVYSLLLSIIRLQAFDLVDFTWDFLTPRLGTRYEHFMSTCSAALF